MKEGESKKEAAIRIPLGYDFHPSLSCPFYIALSLAPPRVPFVFLCPPPRCTRVYSLSGTLWW